jgi:uncharacterized protein (DUF1330 family)
MGGGTLVPSSAPPAIDQWEINMAKGYLVAHITVTDAAEYAKYRDASGALLKKYGATALVDPTTAEIMEGSFKDRTVILEFESLEKAREFWNSDKYQSAKAFRTGSSIGDFMLISGIS